MCIFWRASVGRLVIGLSLVFAFAANSWASDAVRPTSVRSSSSVQVVVRQIKILGTKDFVEIEVQASDRITPTSQILTGPDRLVLDFPNAIPGSELRSQSIYVGAVKDVRAGLFRSKPPVTRLVIDLDSPEGYQIFPAGRTVMIKMATAVPAGTAKSADPWRAPAIEVASQITPTPAIAPVIDRTIDPSKIDPPKPDPPKPSLEVEFVNGLLTIQADKVTLAEILRAVQSRTGAQISIAPGAEQERVVSSLGPAPAQEVLSRLLNGSKFNFLILNAAADPKKLDRVILTPRNEGGPATLQPLQTADQPSQPEPELPQSEAGVPPPPEAQFPPPQPEMTAPPDASDPQ